MKTKGLVLLPQASPQANVGAALHLSPRPAGREIPPDQDNVPCRPVKMLLRAPAAIKLRDWKIWYHGDVSLLDGPLNALLCSKACPGDKILEAIDLAQRSRVENHAVVSGFHTPVERNASGSSCAARSES